MKQFPDSNCTCTYTSIVSWGMHAKSAFSYAYTLSEIIEQHLPTLATFWIRKLLQILRAPRDDAYIQNSEVNNVWNVNHNPKGSYKI
jgi:hypothetical protein